MSSVDAPPVYRNLDEAPDLMTRQELAGFLGVSVQTLARWAVEGTGPRQRKIGHASRYEKADVRQFISAA